MKDIFVYLTLIEIDLNLVAYPIAGALIVMTILKFIRPQLYISEKIARNTTVEGETCFEFKVINNGLFKVINVKAELVFNTNRQNSDGDLIPYAFVIELFRPNVMSIKSIICNKKSGSGQFLFRTKPNTNLDKLWADSNYKDSVLSLSVFSINELSNAPKVKRRFYDSCDLIVDGFFGSRNNCNIGITPSSGDEIPNE